MPRFLFLWSFFLTSLVATEIPPDPPREFRAAWIATVFNLNWPSKAGLPAADQQKELIKLLDLASACRLNAVILQIRPSGDAFYRSSLEPWSAFLTGASGKPPEPEYDPLAFAVDQAHRRGLELHAWVNPFRAIASQTQELAENHVWNQHPEWRAIYGKHRWIDPGFPEARAHVLAVAADIVRRYDIDGFHIDDYFYPYPETSGGNRIDFPDDASWNQWLKANPAGSKISRADWRRQNTDTFVKDLYATVKREKPWVKLGISPFGLWRPTVPEGIKGSLDAYDHLYADSRKWLREGWLDYLSPQLYWAENNENLRFSLIHDWWASENIQKRHLWPGLAVDRIGKDRDATEILRQITMARRHPFADGNGHVLWSIKPLMDNADSVTNRLVTDAYAGRALVPPSPWLRTTPQPLPQAQLTVTALPTAIEVRWPPQPAGLSSPVHWWAVQVRRKGVWHLDQILPGIGFGIRLPLNSGIDKVAVSAVSRFGDKGTPSIIGLP